MFLGHYAVGFGSKKAEPKVSLGTYFMAGVFLDLLWPLFLLLGLEHVKIDPGNTAITPLNFNDYPLSHSLLMSIVWSLLFGGVHYLIKRNKKTSVILGLCVFSHWALDFITHRPDLPLAPGVEFYFGLGLWNYIPGAIFIELILFAGGIFLYLNISKTRDKIGLFALWGFIFFSAITYISNIFSPPPPSVNALKYIALGQWLFVAWGYWIDKHRIVK